MEQPNEVRRTWAQRVVAGGPDRRLLLALLSASVAAWATLWLALLVIYGVDRVERGGPVLDLEELKASFFVAVFWPVVAAPTFVLGTLIHQSLSSFRFRRWPTYALTGCVVGFSISAA
jgi:hypothetical protein